MQGVNTTEGQQLTSSRTLVDRYRVPAADVIHTSPLHNKIFKNTVNVIEERGILNITMDGEIS